MKKIIILIIFAVEAGFSSVHAQCDTLQINFEERFLGEVLSSALLMNMIKNKKYIILDSNLNRLSNIEIENLYREVHSLDFVTYSGESYIDKVVSHEIGDDSISKCIVCLNEKEPFVKRIGVFVRRYAETGEYKDDAFLCWVVL